MDVTEALSMILPFVYVLVLIALIWFIVELVLMVRRTRAIIVDTKKKLDPTLEHVEKITASLEPVAAKIDPLVERVSLTVDAANLEIMRLDQILEDVNEITDTISSAANAVDQAANAPIELVGNLTSRVRNAFKPKRASSESIVLGDQKSADPTPEAAQGAKGAVAEDQTEHQNRSAEAARVVQVAQEAQAAKEAQAAEAARVFQVAEEARTAHEAGSEPVSPNPGPESAPASNRQGGIQGETPGLGSVPLV